MVYVDSSVCRVVVYEWIKWFKKDREQLENDSWERRPYPSKHQENIKLVQNLVKEDHRVTTDGVANEVGITNGSAFVILIKDFGLIKLSAPWVPKALWEDQLNYRADLSLTILL